MEFRIPLNEKKILPEKWSKHRNNENDKTSLKGTVSRDFSSPVFLIIQLLMVLACLNSPLLHVLGLSWRHHLADFLRALEIAMTENGRGEERKINGEPATLILVADREGRLKQNLRKMDGSLTYILFLGPLNLL
jgi:hypothetical protein